MNLKKILYQIIFFLIGAIGYPCIEMLYRAGKTHWTMILVGGLASLAIIDTNLILKQKNIFLRILTASSLVTLIEFVSGLILNVWLGMKVWNYTNLPYNVCGQICLKFSIYWTLLCFAVIVLFELLTFFKSKIKEKMFSNNSISLFYPQK
jgi:uncharacterized membrane protein